MAANRERAYEANRQWRRRNPEKVRETNDRWAREHPEAVARIRRDERDRNGEARRARARARRVADPEAVRAAWRRWYQENPDRARATQHRAWERRRARKRDAFVEDVEQLVVLERDDGLCGICGLDVDPLDFHVDHIIPLALGGEHSYANVQLAHPRCNLAKGARRG